MIYQQATKYCGKEEKSFRQSFQNISNLGVRLHIHSVQDGCSINCFPQFCKSDMSKYGYLEVFYRVPWISYNESRLYFFIYKSLRCFLPSFRSISLSIQEKKRKIDFQYTCHGGHLGFPIGTVFVVFFIYNIRPDASAKFRFYWPFSSGEEAKKIDFQDGRHAGQIGFRSEQFLLV